MRLRPILTQAMILVGAAGLACADARQNSDADASAVAGCVKCHGGLDNTTGAPPFDLAGGSAPTLPSVGAHTAHVQGASVAYGCDMCHPKPTTSVTPLHPDGTVQLAFGSLATAGGTLRTAYSAGTGKCSNTYCHGNFLGGNTFNDPVWTGGAQAGRCGTCHGHPPSALPPGHLELAPGATNATCRACHPTTVKADGTIDVAGGKHVDGIRQWDPAANHPVGWIDAASPSFHGPIAAPDQSSCWRCHAWEGPAHVTKVVCYSCHQYLTY